MRYCRSFPNMLDVPLLMSTLSILPTLFKHPHRDAKWGKEAAFKSSIWLQRIFHWCIVTGDFPSSALLLRMGSETEPDVHVFTDTRPLSWCLAALLATAVATCSLSWMLRLLWHGDSNDNDHDFYGYGINEMRMVIKKVSGTWIIQLRRTTGNQLWSVFFFSRLYENQGKTFFKKYNDEIALNMPTYKLSYFNN